MIHLIFFLFEIIGAFYFAYSFGAVLFVILKIRRMDKRHLENLKRLEIKEAQSNKPSYPRHVEKN